MQTRMCNVPVNEDVCAVPVNEDVCAVCLSVYFQGCHCAGSR